MPPEKKARAGKTRKGAFQTSPRVKASAVKQQVKPSPPLLLRTKYFEDLPDMDEEKSGLKELLFGLLIGSVVGSFLCWMGVELSWRSGGHATGPYYFKGEIVVFCTIIGGILGYLSSRPPRDFRDPFGWWW